MAKIKSTVERIKDRWYLHSQERAMERYGLAYTKNLLQVIRKDYKAKVFNVLLEIPESDRIVLRGRVNGIVVTFIYSTKLKAVVTFLHNSWIDTDTSEFKILSNYSRKSNSSKNLKKKSGALSGRFEKVQINKKVLRKLKSPVKGKLKDDISSKEHITQQFDDLEGL